MEFTPQIIWELNQALEKRGFRIGYYDSIDDLALDSSIELSAIINHEFIKIEERKIKILIRSVLDSRSSVL